VDNKAAESHSSISTIVHMRQFAKKIATKRDSEPDNIIEQEQYANRTQRASAPPRSRSVNSVSHKNKAIPKILPTIHSSNIDDIWIRNALAKINERIDSLDTGSSDVTLKKELWAYGPLETRYRE
jgi:hypothetical protein